MKLVRIRHADGPPTLGVIVDDHADRPAGPVVVDLAALGCPIRTMRDYLAGLPDSRRQVEAALQGRTPGGPALDDVSLAAVVEPPPLLLDMGLTPRHLVSSTRTLLRHAVGAPLAWLGTRLVARGTRAVGPPYRYYKGNPAAVAGPGSVTPWPAYSRFVDVEPELAVVIGAGPDPIAGYTIFDDVSARDVQLPEMIGTGPTRSKDFAGSNVLGPCLVTPDQLGDPRALEVDVRVGADIHWRGSTAEIAAAPAQVVRALAADLPLPPGTVIGLGTIPGCTGLDHDRWLLPGDAVRIHIQGIGTLAHAIGPLPDSLDPSPWGPRPELGRD